MSLAAGTLLGSYEIAGLLGAGGMGEVYRAKDLKLGREVAIKTLPLALSDDKDRLARFEREARLLAALNHANIAAVYGLDAHEGMLYIAMELVEGESLEAKLKAGPLPAADALPLAMQIAHALEAAHAKGVVHRDLKPANVMLTREGVVKVLDFGLAKAFSGEPSEASPAHSPALSLAMTQQGLILGTAGYMSPEQASGQATDQRADVWAFGVVLYEMLTGQPLFAGESVPHVLAGVLRLDPDWSRLPNDLSPRIREVLERCLAKRPRDRYHAIADARIDIERALRDPTGGAAGAGTPAPAVPLLRRVWPVAAAFVVATALAAAGGWMARTPPAQVPMVATDRLPEGQTWLFPQLNLIAIAPDGRQYVMNTTDGIYLRPMGSFEATMIPGISTERAMPAFSPDGQALIYLRPGNSAGGVTSLELARIPITGGTAQRLAVAGDVAGAPMGLSWGNNDDSVVYARNDGVWRFAANGGMPERIVELEADEVAQGASLLPGGEWVLFSVARIDEGAQPDWDTAEIRIQSLQTGQRRVLYSGGSSARYVPTGHLLFAAGSTIYALPFDLDTLAIGRNSVPVVQDVQRDNTTGIAQLDLAANGTLIYVPGGYLGASDGGSVVIVDRDGQVEYMPVTGGSYADARISPDQHAAFTATYSDGQDIAVYELGSSALPRRMTFGGQSRYPVWSHDSSRVIFQSTRDGTASLYAQLADGSGGEPLQLTRAAEGEVHTPDSAHPDGKWLTYTRSLAGQDAIWLLDLETEETRELIATPDGGVSQSVFSPDGRWIAYQSIVASGFEVFVQPFPLTGARYQVPSMTANHHPLWSNDGRELAYLGGIGVSAIIPVVTEPRFGFGAAQTIPDLPMNQAPATRRQFDRLDDGRFFGTAQVQGNNGGELGGEIRIVQGWFDELKRLVPVD